MYNHQDYPDWTGLREKKQPPKKIYTNQTSSKAPYMEDQTVLLSLNQETDEIVNDVTDVIIKTVFRPSFKDILILHTLGVRWDGDERQINAVEEKTEQDDIRLQDWHRLVDLMEWAKKQDLKRR